MKEQDRQRAILSDLIIYLIKLEPETLEESTVQELIDGYFDQQDKLADGEKPFELTGGGNSEVH